MKKRLLLISLLCVAATTFSQSLQPGFNGKEYTDMLKIAFQRYDSSIINPKIPAPENYRVVYRSPELGLMNRWNMWYRSDNRLAVISLRGTVNELPSWLENFYAAMIPATGVLQLNDSSTFAYQLAGDTKAMVHVGWLVGLASLAPTIVEQVKTAYKAGIREFIIAGHIQGGALSFLTRSYLYYLTQKGILPGDIVYKTYCSAAPKPGNTFYAYDFDFITRNGWAFTVVNAADWVPETPFSVQRLSDFNPVNPFANIHSTLKKQSFFGRLYLRSAYNKMNRHTRRAQQGFKKYLGKATYKLVRKNLARLKEPAYADANNYQRAGTPVILLPDNGYYQRFPNDPSRIFIHHSFAAYETLAEQYYPQ
jgi:hypothetical protein